MIPSLVFYSSSELLEGPVFDKENNYLYFVSILDCLVYCYNPSTKEILSMKLDSPVSCVFLLKRKIILVSSKNGFFEIDFNTLQKKLVFQIDIDKSVRYNDGIKDPIGRVIIGTMGYPEVKEKIGRVFSYYKGEYKTIIKNTTISNGLAFSHDGKFLYFIDTPTKKVAKYAYDLKTGEVKFKSNVIEFTGAGNPDGMCIDKSGMLWIAEWGGGCISKWNPLNGEKIEEIKLPCSNVTSCCFDNYSNLYITTAKEDFKEDIYGGGLFYLELDKI
ncbi:MAG: SMP-30/gluconolactonase/LRE family protein [Algibacter sp.]|uniref:SMP-30/gluconolactonase/LRE family protein n=1 Tax=Algibacter sp. TaxID=1872428 RepID=UPI00262F8F3B|nr:SMP-30/gluconolactonase/LRE family protein [Algibacter sp.]MDG1728587.1 SMP-30/gluconolactonase/LRE family protein [Algibacter sp.]MDG2178527.1 SMP-30/gluconolactonase/LRE family protein [Algibacter sp.]